MIYGTTKFYCINKFLLILLLLLSSNIIAQDFVKSYPVFKSGERITYKAVYNWGFIWINAGTVQFNVSDTVYNDERAFYLNASGSSIRSYDWLFKVRDYFHSYTNVKNLLPYYFIRNTYEGGYKVDNEYIFNYRDSLIFSKTENTNKSISYDTVLISKQIHDVLSGIYYIRNLDFENYALNDIIPIQMIIDGEVFELYIRYLGMEILKTHDKRKFNTIKISALFVEGTIFKGGEDLLVWFTDDLNRIPVLVEAKILIGSVKATLNTTENLKFPLSSEIIED